MQDKTLIISVLWLGISILLFPIKNLKAQEVAFVNVSQFKENPLNEKADWTTVSTFTQKGRDFYEQGKFDLAERNYLKAERFAKTLSYKDYQVSRRIFEELTHFYAEQRHTNQAIKVLRKNLTLTISQFGENALNLSSIYFDMGQVYSLMGEVELSTSYYHKAIFILEKHDATHQMPFIYRKLARNYSILGNQDQALSHLKKCLQFPERDRRDVTYRLQATTSIGQIYLGRGEYNMALHYFEQADSVLQFHLAETSDEAFFYHNLRNIDWNYGTYYRAIGKLGKAKKHFRKVLEIYSKKGLETENVGIFMDMAGIYDVEGKPDSALLYNQWAVASVCKNFTSSDYTQFPAAAEFKDLRHIYYVLEQKTAILKNAIQRQKDDFIKKRLLLTGLKVVDLVDEIHANNLKKVNSLWGGQSQSLIEGSISNYQQGLEFAYQYFQLTDSEGMVEKAFYYTQKMKGQQLWLTFLKNEAKNLEKPDSLLLQKEKELKQSIAFYEKKLFEAQQKKDHKTAEHLENEALFEKRKAYNELLQTIETHHPEYFEAKYNFTPETGESLLHKLEEGELVVEYVFLEEALFIFTIAKNQPLHLQKTQLEGPTKESIHNLQGMLKNSTMMRPTTREKFIHLSHELYQQFLQPIEKQLTVNNRLIIIGDGVSHYIPFEVLLSSTEMKPYLELDFLIKKHEISYHYSATLFGKTKNKKANRGAGIYAFAPVYDQFDGSVNSKDTQRSTDWQTMFQAFKMDGSYAPLPGSEAEVKSILALFKRQNVKGDQRLALRSDANEMALKNHLERPYQFIHIAGHSFANLENPLFSGIACSEDKRERQEDGTLYMSEIYNLHTTADLITLSSCESGWGRLENAEGLLGLNRAFVQAGTPNVVFSLWKVYDKVSAKMMVDFYGDILEGRNYSASLRQAKLNLLNREETASPHFWSAYLLIGR